MLGKSVLLIVSGKSVLLMVSPTTPSTYPLPLPEEDVGCGEVVQEAGFLEVALRRDGYVDDSPCAVVRLKGR